MSRRTGISEAPSVVLGVSGRQQLVPVLEVLSPGDSQPGKTSIEEMRAYFAGEIVIPSAQVQQFYLRTGEPLVINLPGGGTPGIPSSPLALTLEKRADSVLIGDPAYYEITNGGIDFTQEGTYKITAQLNCRAIIGALSVEHEVEEEPVVIGDARYEHTVRGFTSERTFSRAGNQSSFSSNNRTNGLQFAMVEFYIGATDNTVLNFSAETTPHNDAGNVSNNARWEFDTGSNINPSTITVARL